MKRMLLGLAVSAAVIVPTAPAQAERWSDPGFVAAANVTVHHGSSQSGNKIFRPQSVDGSRHDHRRHHRGRHHDRDRFGDGLFLGGFGYYYYEDNPAWQADGYNDWWHDRPSRSVPRWVSNNQNCERQYWTGAGWKC